MIELKNICKTYRSKKGTNTKAVNNISLTFDSKGMTFILGKSGSGKSTLLNIIGGLDKYDSGDMLILGKSSKKFTQADFDSYRNTHIGFIFQEYNILDDYNVYENIILALQLQQRKVNSEEVNHLLTKLELEELKNRKVNELSGGQKQRVAIARALIKNPKIILADEPTGNLDSETGKQVMNLLKEISKEKLVIVVSHDNEYANIYGDRIIEIKDGSIIDDIRKTEDTRKEENSYTTIKSKLPLKESFKLGFGSLRHKKIKLVFTILLIVCSLLFFSIADTITNYNIEKAHAKLLKEKEEQFIQINKYQYQGEQENDYYNKEQLSLRKEDIEEIKNKIKTPSYPIYKMAEDHSYRSIGRILNIKDLDNYSPYYSGGTYVSADIVEVEDISSILKENILGRKPQTLDEILISNYLADLMIESGVTVYEKVEENEFTSSNIFKPKNYEEILNSNYTFYFGEKGKVKIVGIIQYDLSKYQILKDKKRTSTKEEEQLQEDMRNYSYNIYNKIYVPKGFTENLETSKNDTLNSREYSYSLSDNQKLSDHYYGKSAFVSEEIEYFDGIVWKKTNHITSQEMIVSIHQLKNFNEEDYKKNLTQYLEKNSFEDSKELEKKFFENYIKNYKIIGSKVTLTIRDNFKNQKIAYPNITIIGILPPQEEWYMKKNYYSKELVENYQELTLQHTGYLIPMTEEQDFKEILTNFPYYENLSATSTYSEDVIMLVWTILVIKKIAWIVSVVLVLFTTFLIANFVFTSIHYRKKEIGVLRALGARRQDIIKIFLWEGLTIAVISGTLSSVLLLVVTRLINTTIMTETELIITPFILGIRQFIMIYFIVLIVTLISIIIPIIKISQMKPIDAILKK